jgi:hypothetical protein
MKLWLLERSGASNFEYDLYQSLVIRAKSQAQARRLAKTIGTRDSIWEDSEKTSCKPLHQKGLPQIILGEFLDNENPECRTQILGNCK